MRYPIYGYLTYALLISIVIGFAWQIAREKKINEQIAQVEKKLNEHLRSEQSRFCNNLFENHWPLPYSDCGEWWAEGYGKFGWKMNSREFTGGWEQLKQQGLKK